MKLAGPPFYNFLSPGPSRPQEKKGAVALIRGSGCGGEMRTRRDENLCPFSCKRISMVGYSRGSPREGSFSWCCLPLTGILFTSREYCQCERQTRRVSRPRCPPLTGLLSRIVFQSGALRGRRDATIFKRRLSLFIEGSGSRVRKKRSREIGSLDIFITNTENTCLRAPRPIADKGSSSSRERENDARVAKSASSSRGLDRSFGT